MKVKSDETESRRLRLERNCTQVPSGRRRRRGVRTSLAQGTIACCLAWGNSVRRCGPRRGVRGSPSVGRTGRGQRWTKEQIVARSLSRLGFRTESLDSADHQIRGVRQKQLAKAEGCLLGSLSLSLSLETPEAPSVGGAYVRVSPPKTNENTSVHVCVCARAWCVCERVDSLSTRRRELSRLGRRTREEVERKRSARRFGREQRREPGESGGAPGPGQYHVGSQIGRQRLSTRPSSPAVSLGSRQPVCSVQPQYRFSNSTFGV